MHLSQQTNPKMTSQTMNNNNTPTVTAPVNMEIDENTMLTWKYVESTFVPSKADLLSDYVDPAEEAHMELKPDDDKSIALKRHKRQKSDATDVTEKITDFSFLTDDMFYDNEDDELMADCQDRNKSVVRMLFD